MSASDPFCSAIFQAVLASGDIMGEYGPLGRRGKLLPATGI